MPDKKSRLYGGKTEDELSPMERLGLAYCRLEGLEWDEHIGPKPQGFDDARDDIKLFIVQRHLRRIEAMVGETFLDRCRWVYDQGRNEAEWIKHQASAWENGHLTLGHRRNDVTYNRGEGVKLTLS